MSEKLGAVLNKPTRYLETFENPNPERDYHIRIDSPEFTCLCPKTGQPDFAEIKLDYIPDAVCVELKSLKLYYWSFRDEGHFHEQVTNMIANDLIKLLDPRQIKVTAVFNVRGGVYTTVEVEHSK
ncbi:7-cyano-7-deazaguanine reductase [Mariprofundus micogutta]|uniref:NADPH-dependent 7-cyano-7-deazaguanine reductase n=1 Tax=Mariprofundus micogutta TaxID=1921010 RepID=A0A1L8CPX2_9PROT|nr:preQ(1) synthase [Mariprofundus micogutta]GAV20986.1 7-cyano-7-deazaguanine reductase [Mariprofundus micogutta]